MVSSSTVVDETTMRSEMVKYCNKAPPLDKPCAGELADDSCTAS